jgi:hypothetical protein
VTLSLYAKLVERFFITFYKLTWIGVFFEIGLFWLSTSEQISETAMLYEPNNIEALDERNTGLDCNAFV